MTNDGTEKKKTIPWTSKVGAWCKKYWWLLLGIPVVLIAISELGGFIEKLFTRPNKPDLAGEDKKYADGLLNLSEEERKKLEAANDEASKIKDGIDEGDPTPADVFDREINR